MQEEAQEAIEPMEETHDKGEVVEKEQQEEVADGEYNPNLKYSVKSEEYEFDDWIRPAITNPEAENHIRELYTRAKGLDHVKSNLEETRRRARELEEEAQRYREESEYAKQGVEGLKKLAKDDFSSFAHLVGIDDKTILGYANNRIDYQEKPEHERRMIDRDLEIKTQSYTKDLELDQLKKQNEKLMRYQHEKDMQQALELPEISNFKSAFDKRMGKEGAFIEHVKEHGSREFQRNRQYVPPLVAVQSVYSQFKPLFMDALEEVKTKTEESSSNPKTKPPTNLGTGRNSTVVTKRIKNTNDLRKLANEMAKRDGY